MVAYFPAAGANLDAALASSLAGIPDGTSKDDGVAVGAAAAAELVALRAGDGSSPPAFDPSTSTKPGEWRHIDLPGRRRHPVPWQNLKPFGVESTSQFRSDPPPSLTSREYTKDYAELLEVGASDSTARPADRAAVARLYAAFGGRHVEPCRPCARSWTSRLAHRSCPRVALLNLAMSDGLATSIETKYHYAFWRPETAIRAGNSDGNDRTVADPTSHRSSPRRASRATRRRMRARAMPLAGSWSGPGRAPTSR